MPKFAFSELPAIRIADETEVAPSPCPSPLGGEENKIPPLKKGDEGGFEISPNPSF